MLFIIIGIMFEMFIFATFYNNNHNNMAKFNYILFREYLKDLLQADYERISIFDAASYMCLMYPFDYDDIFDKIESCVRALVKCGVIEIVDEYDDVLLKLRILKFVRSNGC